MKGLGSAITLALVVGLLASSAAGVAAQDATATSRIDLHGELGLDVRELEWAPLGLDDATFGPSARLVDIVASDSMLVIGGSVGSSAAVWTSTDRHNWTRVPHDEEVFGGSADQEIKAIVPWRDGFVAAGEVGGVSDFGPLRVAVVWVSEDGMTWTRVPHDEEVFGGVGRQEMFDIAATDDRLVIVGFDEGVAGTTNEDIAVWTSTDGFEWTHQTFGGGAIGAVVGTPEGFVGVGPPGVWTSADGVQWEPTAVGDRSQGLRALAPTPSGFVAVGAEQDRPAAWTSSDGATWAPATIDYAPFGDAEWWGLNDVAFADSGLAAAAGPGNTGGNSAILVSEDGTTWGHGNAPEDIADAGLRGIAAFGSHFVAIGGWTSTWTAEKPTIWTTSKPEPPTQDVERAPDAATGGPGTFSPAGSLDEARSNHTATLLSDGQVLVIGGVGEDGSTASAEVWDPATASFGLVGSLGEARLGHSATLLTDGRVLVIGGIDGRGGNDGGMLASVETWDPATGAFSPAGSLAEARSTHTATMLSDGRVLVVGGRSVDDEYPWAETPPASAETWDPATGSFSPSGSLTQAREGHTATLLPDGRVLVAGGWGGGSDGGHLVSAEVWDPATGTFNDAGTMQPGLNRPTATLLADGRVLVIGEGGARVWDPATASFSGGGSPVGGIHMWHTATLLPDGRVLVVGGGGGVGPTASEELWDPTTATFSRAGSLGQARMMHTATLLPDGRVLVVGGSGYDPAEVWEPGEGQPPSVEENSDSTTTPDLLPGVDLVTEVVEPGVYRVLDDGAGHDLVAEPPAGVTIGADGSVWLLRASTQDHPRMVDALVELGQAGTHPSSSGP